MANTKIKFRASSVETREGTIYYQVIHNRVARQIAPGYKLFPQEWDEEKMEVTIPASAEKNRCKYLLSLQATIREETKRLECTILSLEHKGQPYTTDDIVEAFQSHTNDKDFIFFARTLVKQLESFGRKRIAEIYTTATNSFERFRGGYDVALDEVDSDLMMAYESHLKSTGICSNSISFYMRNLRSIYNRAVEKGLVEQRHPFKHVYIGIGKTVKRAVPLEIIRKIKNLDLSLQPSLEYARDIFLFSFYTRGMSFIDIAFLKKKDLQNGILSYRRRKTGQLLSIKWEKPMQEIVSKYATADTPYLLPIIKGDGRDERTQYRNEAHRINRNLKKVGELIGLGIPLTTYVARHGWASIAKSKNIPISTISEAMGHDSEATTRIYLASLDTSLVDKANRLILRAL